MKRHLYKFLLSLVRALVFAKRFLIWLFGMIGRFFVWLARPLMLFVVVPVYAFTRRMARQYRELSENPRERRRIILTSQPVLVVVGLLCAASVARAAFIASTRPGVIPGSQSFLLSKIFVASETDWSTQDITALTQAVETPTVVYSNGAAYVFPFNGLPGRATQQTPEQQKQEPQKKKPIQKYAVQRGDTLARIAKKFGIHVETILWANTISEKTMLRAGDVLTIPAVDGVLYTVKHGGRVADVAHVFKVRAETIATANNMSANSPVTKGTVLVIPGVRQAQQKPPHEIARVEPTPAPPPIQQPEPQPAPEPQDQNTGTQPQEGPVTPTPEQPPTVQVTPRPQLAPGAKLLWPTRQHSITQYFSGHHPGVDLSGTYTDPVYAADDGTVIQSGWNDSGYGNMILIDHGNGIRTRYGHNSKVFVHVGQEVHRGDIISMVGTTGRSTGTHLHFEVIVNGTHVNPLRYIR